ncbi:VOC family protein [Bacillus sp. RG28]|uniref:VOC family protein n=1 Tax=Gottfriedia endophytica TaxID=2820819 RepID=A0A940NN22_9BACI|nr:VOC family protein [Gottfriedia endophytica]MBP0723716.1 VOC family protein [Gottfriedia endophytica]
MKHQITPYLYFNGNAREALECYKEIFDGEIMGLQTYGEANFPSPPEADNLIIHAQFKKGDLFIMASDAMGDKTVEIGSNISLALELESEEEIQTLYDRFTQHGTVLMELQDTFWGAKYGKVKDKFGVIWDLNYTKPQA